MQRLLLALVLASAPIVARAAAGRDDAIDLVHFRGEVAARAIFEESNRQRVAAGAPRLAPLAAAQTAAQWQAQFMADVGAISHINTNDRTRRTLEDRIRAVGLTYQFIGENVAMNFAIDYEARRPMYPRRGPNGEVQFSYSGDGPPLRPHTYASLARTVVNQWMASPGHRQNLLSPKAKCLGCAAVPGRQDKSGGLGNIYCSQVFVTTR